MPNFFAGDLTVIPADVILPPKTIGLWEYYFNLSAIFSSSKLHFDLSKIHTEYVIRSVEYKFNLSRYSIDTTDGYKISTVIIRDPSIMSDYVNGNDSLETYTLGGEVDNEVPVITGVIDPMKYYSSIPWCNTKQTPKFPYLFVKVENYSAPENENIQLHIELVVSVSYRGSRMDLSPVTTSVYY